MKNEIIDVSDLSAVEFETDNQKKLPCVLLLDVSYSMVDSGDIDELNDALASFTQELNSDIEARNTVEVSIVTFGGNVSVECDFTPATEFSPKKLVGNGNTPMGAAIQRGVEMVSKRRKHYKNNDVSAYKAWIFLLTDGVPTDTDTPAWSSAVREIRNSNGSDFTFWAIATGSSGMSSMKRLKELVDRPLYAKDASYKELFKWLSDSLSQVSQSNIDEQLRLVAPTGCFEVGT